MRIFKKILFATIFLISINSPALASEEYPQLVTRTIDQKIFDLKNQKNKIVIINFWAYWCSNCRREMLILNDLYKKYHDQGLEIIGVSIDSKGERQEFLKVASSTNYPNSMLIDASQNSFVEPNLIPFNYVIDKNGKLIMHLTSKDSSNFEKIIKSLL